MEFTAVKAELRRLLSMVDEWSTSDNIPAIERDLALDKLKQLYETLRFESETSSEASSSDDNNAQIEIEHQIDIDLDELSIEPTNESVEAEIAEQKPQEPITPHMMMNYRPTMPAKDDIIATKAKPNEPAREELGAEDFDDEFDIEEITEQPKAEESATSTTLEQVIADEPVAADEVSEQALTDTEEFHDAEESEEEPTDTASVQMQSDASEGTKSEPVVDDAPQPQHVPTISERAKQRGSSDGFSSLFDINDVPQVRRQRRSIIMSLYDDRTTTKEVFDNEPATDDGVSAIKESIRTMEELERDDTPRATAPERDELIADEPTPYDDCQPTEKEPTVIENQKQTIGDVTAHKTLSDAIQPPKDIASQLTERPLNNLRRGIGINDKFLMVRDLFGGDSHEFDNAIDTLNSFDNLDDCMIYIAENYVWNAESDGAKFIMQLLERRFLSK